MRHWAIPDLLLGAVKRIPLVLPLFLGLMGCLKIALDQPFFGDIYNGTDRDIMG